MPGRLRGLDQEPAIAIADDGEFREPVLAVERVGRGQGAEDLGFGGGLGAYVQAIRIRVARPPGNGAGLGAGRQVDGARQDSRCRRRRIPRRSLPRRREARDLVPCARRSRLPPTCLRRRRSPRKPPSGRTCLPGALDRSRRRDTGRCIRPLRRNCCHRHIPRHSLAGRGLLLGRPGRLAFLRQRCTHRASEGGYGDRRADHMNLPWARPELQAPALNAVAMK